MFDGSRGFYTLGKQQPKCFNLVRVLESRPAKMLLLDQQVLSVAEYLCCTTNVDLPIHAASQ